MLVDLDQVDSDPFENVLYDVCICGAGPAGLSLALKISRSLQVLLLEGGGMQYSDRPQNLL